MLPGFDPRVVHAVWDALQPCRKHRGGFAPLRASDRMHSFIDVDDTYNVVVVEVADRSRRSLDGMENNPKFNHVEAVRDLVEFFWAQGTLSDPPQRSTNQNR